MQPSLSTPYQRQSATRSSETENDSSPSSYSMQVQLRLGGEDTFDSLPRRHRNQQMGISFLLNSSDQEPRPSTSPSPLASSRVTPEDEDDLESMWSAKESSSTRASSVTSIHPSGARPARPPYTEEEACFIWFLVVDCKFEWDEMALHFNRKFSREHREKSGLQCRYYRKLEKETGLSKSCPRKLDGVFN